MAENTPKKAPEKTPKKAATPAHATKKKKGGNQCVKCKFCSCGKFFHSLPALLKKPKDNKYESHVTYVAKKFLHDENMRRVGRANEIKKWERLCIWCKVVDHTEKLEINHNGEKTWQKFSFRVCKAEGKKSSMTSPSRITRGTLDRRVMREHEDLQETAKENSEKGKEARLLILAQQMHGSVSGETSPQITTKERVPPKEKPPNPFAFFKIEPN